MRTFLLAVSLLAFAVCATGCNATARISAAIGDRMHERPLDNFGEILTERRVSPTLRTPHGGLPSDNFGEIL